MNIYLVGGAVRNRLLNIPVSDYDWVVVGAEQIDLIKLGFKQVGRDFPVFLHPKTQEEYALARIERKIKKGHTGFFCYFNSSVTIEQDLSRRDLTINAIAVSYNGVFIDPFDGLIDIKNRILRHVSSSFIEDPLRILRIARFFSQLYKYGFTIAYETKLLIKKMIINGEIKTISPERIWKETKKALISCSPDVYFNMLYQYNILFILIPDIFYGSNLINDFFKQKFKKYPFLILRETVKLTNDISVRFSAFCCDVIKNLNCLNKRFFFLKNRLSGIFIINEICCRFSIPNKLKELAKISVLFYKRIQNIRYLDSKSIVNLLNKIDFWRRPNRVFQILIISNAECISKKKNINLKEDFFVQIFNEIQNMSFKNIFSKNISGFEIKKKIYKNRIKILNKLLKKYIF